MSDCTNTWRCGVSCSRQDQEVQPATCVEAPHNESRSGRQVGRVCLGPKAPNDWCQHLHHQCASAQQLLEMLGQTAQVSNTKFCYHLAVVPTFNAYRAAPPGLAALSCTPTCPTARQAQCATPQIDTLSQSDRRHVLTTRSRAEVILPCSSTCITLYSLHILEYWG